MNATPVRKFINSLHPIMNTLIHFNFKCKERLSTIILTVWFKEFSISIITFSSFYLEWIRAAQDNASSKVTKFMPHYFKLYHKLTAWLHSSSPKRNRLYSILTQEKSLQIKHLKQKTKKKFLTYQFNFWAKTFKYFVSFFCFFLQRHYYIALLKSILPKCKITTNLIIFT